jgi:hypothetical protein
MRRPMRCRERRLVVVETMRRGSSAGLPANRIAVGLRTDRQVAARRVEEEAAPVGSITGDVPARWLRPPLCD